MDSITEDADIGSKPTVNFITGVSLKDLLSDSGAIFEIKYDDFVAEETEESANNDISEYTNFECLGLEDEDTYNDTEPFVRLAEKMTNLLPDGKVKKRILREGVGNGMPENGYVICDYNAYIEYGLTPFDSTYARSRPFKFRLGTGQTIPGLEIAIQSMKISEKSQFLIHPDLAYGKMGCLSRVPPDTQVLFEIEIKNCLHTGPTVSYPNLGKEEQEDFSNVYDYAQALCIKGNTFYRKNLIKQAIKEYNMAVSKLETCMMADYKDQELQEALLLKLYSNLVVAYTKIQVPRKACICANTIFRLVKGTNLKIPTKVYFNNARSLMLLGDLDSAKQKLQRAKRMEPKNATISEEFVKLEEMIKENHNRELKLAQTIFKQGEKRENKSNVTEEFKETLKEYFNELNNDPNHTAYNLPNQLNEAEIDFIKTSVQQFNLVFGSSKNRYFIYKDTSINQD